jgi:hypothetical protein
MRSRRTAATLATLLAAGLLSAPSATARPVGACHPWSIVPSPNVQGESNALSGVTVESPTDVWAVGTRVTASSARGLAEHWNGSSWSIVPTPPPPQPGGLNAVDAVASDDVWAVGTFSADEGVPHPLAEHWDGTSWSVVPVPDGGTTSNDLTGVVALAADDVWAVGFTSTEGPNQTLIEHWNGTAWSVVPSPDQGAGDNFLWAVAATSSTDVWAAGQYDAASGRTATLVLHWDGTGWSGVPSPNVGPLDNALFGITAIGPDDAWAVGYRVRATDGHPQTLTERWDGTAWRPVSSGNRGDLWNYFTAAAALNDHNLWVAGYDMDADKAGSETLIGTWNGSTRLRIVGSPNAGGGLGVAANELRGVDVVSPTDAWVVGHYVHRSRNLTLIEHYTGCQP